MKIEDEDKDVKSGLSISCQLIDQFVYFFKK